MTACEHCRHYSECFEQRGKCADFETEKQYRKRVKQEIEMLNQKAKPAKAAASDNKSVSE